MKQVQYQHIIIEYLQIVKIRFEANIQIPSAQNIFIFEANQEYLGIQGHYALIFGLTNYALVLIDKAYSQSGYKVQWVKDYQTIAQQTGQISFVNMIADQYQDSRQGFKEHSITFLLGVTTEQKVFQLRVSLTNDGSVDSYGGYPQIMTFQEETLIFQEQKSFTSRLSNFLGSKLGYRAEDGVQNNQKCVRDIQNIGPFVVIITNKDIIIVRKPDMTKVYEQEYLDTQRQISSQNDNEMSSVSLMKELLSFSYLTSTTCLIESTNQLCITILFKKQELQQNPQSYQTFKSTQIIKNSRFLSIDRETMTISQIQEDDNSRNPLQTDKQNEGDDIYKAFSFSYEFFTEQGGVDVTCLLFIEPKSGKTFGVEYSLFNNLQNLKYLENQKIQGITFSNATDDSSREQIVRVSIISSDDVAIFEFDPALISFSNVQPISLKQIAQQNQEENVSQVRPQQSLVRPRLNEQVIVPIDQLKPFIYRLLDQVASYKYANITKSQYNNNAMREEAIKMIKDQTKKILSQFTTNVFINEIKLMIIESIDQQIDDTHIYNRGLDEIRLAFNDDGFILRSLENKEKKLDVIEEYLYVVELLSQDINLNADIRDMLSALRFNMYAAQLFISKQEKIKAKNQQSQAGLSQYQGIKTTDYIIEMRLISKVLQNSAEKLGFNKFKREQAGTSASNIVLANISNFSKVIQIMVSLCLESNIQQVIDLNQQEDALIAVYNLSQILNSFLMQYATFNQNIPLNYTFLRDIDLLNDIFKLCEKIANGCSSQRKELKDLLCSLCRSFIEVASLAGIESIDYDLFSKWKNNLVLFIEHGVGAEEALQFARDYQCRELLCRLVFDLGPKFYIHIHECIEIWGEEFLFEALDQIYSQEKIVIQRRREGLLQNQQYRGLQMFDIFEEKYYEYLEEYLGKKNHKLFTLLILRHHKADQANEILRANVIPSIQNVNTMKVFASIAVTNVANCVQNVDRPQRNENQEYFETQLSLAQSQSEIHPYQEKLERVDEQFIRDTFDNLNKKYPLNIRSNLSTVLDVIDKALQNDLRPPENPAQLKFIAWSFVSQMDRDQLSRIQSTLQDGQIYTQEQIRSLINSSHLYNLAQEYRDSNANLDQDSQSQLLQVNEVSVDGLRTVINHLNASDPNPFSQRQSIAQETINQSMFID